ncbi:BlaI/MecI/CopY family transcriptional regulator [Halobacillus sp. ACCC02827]|uniref:BlaI/MecI/CopY family transcriptional regulator n=1 Tax=unclassified Halobacillus TaxID=2636472 RepID=UPI0007819C3F|nr:MULTISPECIES: BlaI/MecI/CopY family transcriptional regulator [unclassified Halobacillus]WJE17040.1 BlaI/MecI/CopY family transcriptional regulator [Halobacillus sp. ACCC02827]
MKIQPFKTNEKGLNRFFGPLEARVMDVLWNGSEMSIKAVKERLDQEQEAKFNTVMTVMNRLVDKGVLTKRIEKRKSLYTPVLTREEFLNDQSKELTKGIMDEFGSLAVNHMLDALEEADPGLLEKLEKKVQQLNKEK